MCGTIRSQGESQVKPRYPELARRLGIQGTVLPNASAHLLPEAEARHERRLEAVRCSALFGACLPACSFYSLTPQARRIFIVLRGWSSRWREFWPVVELTVALGLPPPQWGKRARHPGRAARDWCQRGSAPRIFPAHRP